ncbi:MAG: ATP-binding protein, partial [Vicinamibacterales bacterium]
FTLQMLEIFTDKARDHARPISDLKRALDYDLHQDARHVLTTLTPIEREAQSEAGRSYIVRLGPYRSAGGREVAGVVVTFVDVTPLKTAEAAVRASEARLASELQAMRRLHEMTLRAATAESLRDAVDEVLAAAIELHGADCGLIQLCEREGRTLQILSQRGFVPPLAEGGDTAVRPLQWAADRALKTGRPLQIEDVATLAGAGALQADAARTGYRAVQALPLAVNGEELCGVLSLHYRAPHRFTSRDSQLADLLGHVAAGLIESRRQQDQLQAVNASLHERTRELESSQAGLSRQTAELRAADAHRDQFVAALGHELRNPLAAIQSSLALMTVDDDRSRRALAVLKRQAQHMSRLVNDLLDLTRVKFGTVRLDRAPVDLNQAVLAAVEAIRPRAASKRLSISCELPTPPVVALADAERIAQVLDNLLSNAVTYTDAGSVVIRVQTGGAVASIHVRDSGRGVSPEDLPTLFEPYRRVAERQGEDGLGLGLTVVKALVEAHGGTIGVRSDGPGTGCEFRVTLPVGAASSMSSASETPPPLRRRRVLVVDDERDVADMLGALLEALGQEVFVAYAAEDALARAGEHRPEVAFIDVSMPHVSGATLSRQLRRAFPPPALILVAVSGHAAHDARVRAGDFDRHLLKPATIAQVVEVLSRG